MNVLRFTRLLYKNFQEENPLKLTSLAVITLLVLGCSSAFAASGSFSLGFLSYTGGLQYCDYEVVIYSTPFALGQHNLTSVCGLPFNGVMVGFSNHIPSTEIPVTDNVLELADNTFDAEFGAFTGCQIDWDTKKVASKKFWGWEFLYTCGGGAEYLGNFGYLTKALGAPTHNGAAQTSFGKKMGNKMNKK